MKFRVVADVTVAEDRNKYLSRLDACISFAYIVGPAIGGILAQVSNHFPMYVAGIVSGIAMIVALIFGGLTIMRMYVNIPGLPAQIYDMFPYIATILVLVITSMRQSREHAQPKSCGLNYFREER